MPYLTKIKYKISETSTLQPENIKVKILFKLKDEKYRVISVTNNSVTFVDDPFKIVSRTTAVQRLSGGEFIINSSGVDVQLQFDYYVNIWPQLLILAGLTIFLVINGQYFGIPFFTLFCAITTLVQYVISKNKGVEILKDIAGKEDDQ